MFETTEGRITLKHLLQQAQAGPRGGDGELGVQWNHYQVCHAIPLDLQRTDYNSATKAPPSIQSRHDRAVGLSFLLASSLLLAASSKFDGAKNWSKLFSQFRRPPRLAGDACSRHLECLIQQSKESSKGHLPFITLRTIQTHASSC